MVKKRVFVSATVRLRSGIASEYIKPFAPRSEYLTWCRVSDRMQRQRGNLDNQEHNLKCVADSVGATVIGGRSYVGSGFEPSHEFLTLVAIAKRTGATILAESVDRFIRNLHYHSKILPDLQPTDAELQKLADAADGVEMMVHLHPDSTPRATRSYQRMRGREAKGNRGGRPKKVTPVSSRPIGYGLRFNDSKIELAKLLQSCGLSIREVAMEMERSHSTVQGWLTL